MKATRFCSFPKCGRAHSAKGLCATHYEQQRLRGALKPIKLLIASDTPFWDRVDKGDDPDGCWNWTAGTRGRREGRGCLKWNGRQEMAYRVAWMLEHGPIPEGMFVCHACDNPACVRPSHLFIGTPADNTRDMWSKGRGSQAPRYTKTGDRHHGTRYSDAQVAAIRERHAAGETQVDLVRATGMSQSQMSRILNGDARKDAR